MNTRKIVKITVKPRSEDTFYAQMVSVEYDNGEWQHWKIENNERLDIEQDPITGKVVDKRTRMGDV